MFVLPAIIVVVVLAVLSVKHGSGHAMEQDQDNYRSVDGKLQGQAAGRILSVTAVPVSGSTV